MRQSESQITILQLIRGIVVFFFAFFAPTIIRYCLELKYLEKNMLAGLLFLFLMAAGLWLHPPLSALSGMFLWLALFLFGAELSWETDAPANITRDKIDFYEPVYSVLIMLALVLSFVCFMGYCLLLRVQRTSEEEDQET